MTITRITIKCEGNFPGYVEFVAIPNGTRVTHFFEEPSLGMKGQTSGEMHESDDEETRYDFARKVAGLIYGESKRGPHATNSMIHDVMHEIARVAGC